MKKTSIIFLVLLCCKYVLKPASCTNITKVLNVLVVHNYCTQEGLDSQLVFSDINATLFALAMDYTCGADCSWELNISEGGKMLEPKDAVLDHLLTYGHCADFFAIITPGCSQETQYIAEICDTTIFDCGLLTYTFSELDTAHLFRPSHFRLVPSELHLATGIAAVIEEYRWERMVLITQPLPVFHAISEQVSDLLNITIKNIQLLETDIRNFSFPKDHRIFVLNTHPVQAARVLCQAYLQGMLFPDYVWVTYGWYPPDWWVNVSNCTNSQMVSVLAGSIAISHYPDNVTTGLSGYSQLASDALLALLSTLGSHGQISPDSIRATQFTGLSGPVAFESNTNSRVLHQVSILQYNRSTGFSLDGQGLQIDLIQIGHVDLTNTNHTFKYRNGASVMSVWNGDIPADGTPVTVLLHPLLPLMVVCYTVVCAGIVFAVVCFTFNILFRNRKLIRLTSPTINYVIIVGTVVFYLSVFTFFYLPDTPADTVSIVCNFRVWLTSIGFSLCYIPINVKMWRVFHISRKPSLNKTLIKDWHLLLCILAFVIVDVIILVTVTSITGSRYSTIVIPDKENPGTFVNEDGFTSSYVVRRCYSATEIYWLPVVFGYKFLLQAVGVGLAFGIRKVKIKGLNDSKEVSIILYITSAILFVVMLVTFIFGDYINVDGGVYGLGISAASTVVLGFLFIPKMYGLYIDPKGENIFSTKSVVNSGTVRSQAGVTSGNEALTNQIGATSPWNNITMSDCNFTSVDSLKETNTVPVEESPISDNKTESDSV